MDGATDVQSGRIFAGSKGGDGGGDEHPGDCADVWPAPGYGAQNAGLFGPAGLSPTVSAWKAQVEALHRRHRPDPGGRSRAPQEQSHTAKRIFERLRDEYGVSTADIPRSRTTSERIAVRPGRCSCPCPIPPGHAQCDFGEALVVIGDVEHKTHCFVIDLPHSDGCFVKAYPAET